MAWKCNRCGFEVDYLGYFNQWYDVGDSSYDVPIVDDVCPNCKGDMLEVEKCDEEE